MIKCFSVHLYSPFLITTPSMYFGTTLLHCPLYFDLCSVCWCLWHLQQPGLPPGLRGQLHQQELEHQGDPVWVWPWEQRPWRLRQIPLWVQYRICQDLQLWCWPPSCKSAWEDLHSVSLYHIGSRIPQRVSFHQASNETGQMVTMDDCSQLIIFRISLVLLMLLREVERQ